MQRTLRNLGIAVVAGTFALAAVAQDEPKKAPKKAAAASAGATGRMVVNGVSIPQTRIDAMNKELTAQGQPDTPERAQAVKEELINREILAQAAAKRGIDKNPDVAAQMDMARQAVLVRALFESEVKANPISDAQLQQQYEAFKSTMGSNEYKVRHILVDKEDDAKAIIAELQKGGDFAKIAKDKPKDPGSKTTAGEPHLGPRRSALWGTALRHGRGDAPASRRRRRPPRRRAPVRACRGPDGGHHHPRPRQRKRAAGALA